MVGIIDRTAWTYAGRDVTAHIAGTSFVGVSRPVRSTFPLFEIVSNPTVRLAEIRARRFSILGDEPGFMSMLRVQVLRTGVETPVYEQVC